MADPDQDDRCTCGCRRSEHCQVDDCCAFDPDNPGGFCTGCDRCSVFKTPTVGIIGVGSAAKVHAP